MYSFDVASVVFFQTLYVWLCKLVTHLSSLYVRLPNYVNFAVFLASVWYLIGWIRNNCPLCITVISFTDTLGWAAHLQSRLGLFLLCLFWEIAVLTHWGRVTHVCVGKLIIIGSDNGLSPGRRQAIIWTIAGILLIGPLGTNFSEILIGIQTFSFKKMHLECRLRNGVHLVSASMC